MGMPEIVVSFKEAARTIMARSERGVVVVIVNDDTAANTVTKLGGVLDIGESFTAKNAEYLTAVFENGAKTVLAVRAQTTMSETLALLKTQVWNWMCFPEATAEETAAIVTWIKAMRADGKTCKAVLANAVAPNCQAIVNFTTEGMKNEGIEITTGEYCARVAGILAGLPLDRSATYFEVKDVTEITESADRDADIDAGKLILFHERGKFRIARGVTSLIGQSGVSNEFKKIKHVEGCDMIADDIRNTFEDGFVGKVANSYDNKSLFIASVNRYLAGLTGNVLDPDFENRCDIDVAAQKAYLTETGVDTSEMDDDSIKKYNTDSAVFLKIDLKLLDAMEDMVLTVVMN